jgi:hypothetical protein
LTRLVASITLMVALPLAAAAMPPALLDVADGRNAAPHETGAQPDAQSGQPDSDEKAREDGEKDGKDEVRRPSLHMRASPAVVFNPARVRVSAELRGGSDESPELYCPSVEWEWGDGTRSEAQMDCEPFEPGKSEIRRRFAASHQYNQAGRFEVRLRLKRGNKVIVAGQVNIQVRPGARDFGNPF